MVAVVAPAGYGKTTLLAQWTERDPRLFAWLSFDRTFNDPAVLLTYLAFALAHAVDVGPEVYDCLIAPHPAERSAVLAALASSVSRSPAPVVLVFDDVHLLTEAEGIQTLQTLAEHLPEGSQLAVAARREPPIGLARMRADGSVLDLTAHDLRFDSAEARELLAATGADLHGDQLADLVSRTDGWPAALYVAGLAGDAAAFPEMRPGHFTGEDRLLVDYVRSEFLDELLAEDLLFLTRTSVLDELSGPLCDATLLRSGSAAVLEALEKANLLLIPLDRHRLWYRYVQVFREILRHELDRHDPAAARVLQLRASDWCAENGLLDSAVRYAQLARDPDRVGRILLQHGMRQYALGRAAVLRGWIEWLAEHDPLNGGVAVLGAWLYLLSGQAADADRLATIADQAPRDVTLPDGSTLAAWIRTLRAAMALDVEQMRTDAETAFELLAAGSQWRPTAAVMFGLAELYQGNLDAADLHLADAVELGAKLGGSAAVSTASAARAIIALRRGRWQDAKALLEKSVATVRAAHLRSYSTTALTYAVQARVAMHDGDPRAARECTKAAEGLLPVLTRALAHLAIQTRLELIRAYVALGDVDAATERLVEVSDLLRSARGFGSLRSEAEELSAQIDQIRSSAPAALGLTAAELRLLPQLATQLSFREIAEAFFLSSHTVKAQVTSIYRKLGASSRTQAIERARSLGLLPG